MSKAKIYEDKLALIGQTPLLKLRNIVPADAADIYVKLEYFNLGGSIKDRIAKNMIERAEEAGVLKQGDTLVEASSGNTGIGIALVAAVKGYKAVLVLPDAVSEERKKLIKAYGAELIETPAAEGVQGTINKAEELAREKGYISLRQFANKYNPEVHYQTTGPEILAAFGDEKVDAFVAGVGTGGTITGVGRYLKDKNAETLVIAVEPAKSPVLSGGEPSPHLIQGIGAGIIPEVLDTNIYDEIAQVTDEQAVATMQQLAKYEGVLLGISSGAAVFAGIEKAKQLGKGKKVVVIAPDTGERYLSLNLE